MLRLRVVPWVISYVVIIAYIGCAPAVSIYLSDILFGDVGTATKQLLLPYRAVWGFTTIGLVILGFWIFWPPRSLFWRLLSRKRWVAIAVLVFWHIVIFQSFWWRLPLSLWELNIPIPHETMLSVLTWLYYPPLALYGKIETQRPYDPGWWILAVAFSILIYSILSTIMIVAFFVISYRQIFAPRENL
jgi:hypothetical protein